MHWIIPSQAVALASLPEPSDEVDSVMAVIQGFLAALRTKNPVDFEKYCVRAGGMSVWPPSPTLPRFCTIGAFVEQVTRIQDEIDERIWDPEVKVYSPGNMAAVWAPFRAKVNGVVHHVGVELFILHKVNANRGRKAVVAIVARSKRCLYDVLRSLDLWRNGAVFE
ncbi:uncharacterized protein BO96DRAFT_461228 [Aspergillus niger CBS 101883]|uniref:Uncharacterized protein n=3 Tax=Aspergillus niger TaxID=5061 RepID=A2QE79_ASPNC|nr:uncharacterized protein BO96DRAFT_461228 [Aspergillus niger CBS 101883]XP_059600066.1 hypothetical protein An02g09710 [Aspergillus niger]PYH61723.1 hypothetical protein BO96DRAFT_461228 [Aspergillus niger CBS 101883]RDH23024.1 hypothetical protein M747DRAFT_313073 [Aspergillus niger ATCC 13496]CAK37840.1 hypothetical protein An02g09710 [Aspergillus niger]